MKDNTFYIKEIEFITENSIRLREDYIKRNYPELHSSILEHISFYNIELLEENRFTPKLWYFINGIKETFRCIHCKVNVTRFNKNWKDGFRHHCSSQCAGQSTQSLERAEKTNMEKYGQKHAVTKEVMEKIEKTNMERYGHKSSFQSEKVRKTWKNNVKEKYGVEHISQVKEITDKTKETHFEKYGGWFNSTEEYKKLKDEWLKSEYPDLKSYQESDDYKEKTKKTNQEKYGVDHYFQSDKHKELRKTKKYLDDIKHRSFISRKQRIESKHPNILLLNGNDSILTVQNTICNHVYDIHYDSLLLRTERKLNTCLVCLPHSDISTRSMVEDKLCAFIKEIYNGEIITSYKFSGKKELDIYLPSLKLGIEFNGIYWHSEVKKDKNYHIEKTKLCNSLGIDLIHIWEDDWVNKEDIVKSLLKNRLGLIPNKIYARNCEIKVITDNNLVNNFLNTNHIQGKCNSKIKLGLYYNDSLVSLMTFGSNRFSSEGNSCELLRFCSLLDTSIIGGASKLFKFFLKNYVYDTIISYADIAMFKGSLYEGLGFEYVHLSKPNYYWVIQSIRRHRYNFRKSELIKQGFDPSKTEDEIMYSRGYTKIWGCGQVKYLYKNP